VRRIILRDNLDVLVDLSGHTAGNMLSVFASRAAPLQLSYAGYDYYTGVPAIDYHIGIGTDPRPKTNRLCFNPPADLPLPNDPPNCEYMMGYFGSHTKITPDMIEFIRLCQAETLIKCEKFSDDYILSTTRARFAAKLKEKEMSLITFERPQDTYQKHMEQYNRILHAIDSTPYHGTTTTCEALFMGVRVLTQDRYDMRHIFSGYDDGGVGGGAQNVRSWFLKKVCDQSRHAEEWDAMIEELWNKTE
jgi:hypothetical protein